MNRTKRNIILLNITTPWGSEKDDVVVVVVTKPMLGGVKNM